MTYIVSIKTDHTEFWISRGIHKDEFNICYEMPKAAWFTSVDEMDFAIRQVKAKSGAFDHQFKKIDFNETIEKEIDFKYEIY